MDSFYVHTSKVFNSLNGKLWMKTDHGGLLLIPFDGKNCPVIETCFRLMLNQHIISSDVYGYNTLLKYKIAIDVGKTQYQEIGKTGNIISDSINYIFHLGQQYSNPGDFILTKDLYNLIPEGLKDSFSNIGLFQSKELYRMKRLA